MEVISMKLTKATIISIIVVSLVLAGVLIAGCTQDNTSAAPTGSTPSSATSGSPGGMNNGNASYGNHPNFMQNLLNNATLLNSAASQLEYLRKIFRMLLHRQAETARTLLQRHSSSMLHRSN